VAVIEAVDIGFGASGRNAGMVNPALWVRPEVVCRTLGRVYGERLLKLLGDSPGLVFKIINDHGIECEAQHNGTLHCAADRAGLQELEQRMTQWKARDAPVQLLNAAETQAKMGSSAFLASMLDMRAGTIQPLAYARGLAQAAIRFNTQIFVGQPVAGAERSASGWRVRTRDGSVDAPWVVVATDAYSSGPWATIRAEQIYLPYFNLATSPLSETLRRSVLPAGHGAWDTKKVLSSYRLDGQGRFVFGSVGALRGSGITIHRAWAKRETARLFPQIAHVEFESAWYGHIGMTHDSMPRFHKLAPNVISFSGYNGRGIGPGTAFGRVIAQYVTGAVREEELPLPMTQLQEPGLRHLKEALYELGSQIVHLTGARAAHRRS
jgi:glycine/D-amino acid oxidase-like deaminating enzyme